MRITIGSPGIAGTELQADNELRRAFGVLHGAGILTRGGGRFADSSVAIILSRETDAPHALAALKEAGIRALAS
jgi:acyl-coenzyme A thioesterase PaaI-like protein